MRKANGKNKGQIMGTRNIQTGFYALQFGSWQSFEEAVRCGADYLIMDGISINDSSSISMVIDSLWMAEALIKAIGAKDDWKIIYWDGSRVFESDEIVKIYNELMA